MKYILPQEIQVWYILPVLRKELSKVLVKEQGLSQKETARLLSLTEGAVSQYLNAKRGNKIEVSEEVVVEIRKSAATITANPSKVLNETIRLLNLDSVWDLVCKFHKVCDPQIKGKCSICAQYRKTSREKLEG